MAINNANVVTLNLDGNKVAVVTSNTFSLERETIETTSKDDGTTATFIPGKKTSTLSVEGYVDPSFNSGTEQGFNDLYDLYDNDTTFSFEFSDGSKSYSGTCFFTSLERSGGQNEAETFSGELQITGSITVT